MGRRSRGGAASNGMQPPTVGDSAFRGVGSAQLVKFVADPRDFCFKLAQAIGQFLSIGLAAPYAAPSGGG